MDPRIEARIAALEAELSNLKALVANDAEPGAPTSDRRGMIKLVAASAVGAVTGAALLGAQPAAAADGDPVIQGEINESHLADHRHDRRTEARSFSTAWHGYGVESRRRNLANALFTGTGRCSARHRPV